MCLVINFSSSISRCKRILEIIDLERNMAGDLNDVRISKYVFSYNYGLWGQGFGVPYVSLDFAYELFYSIGAQGFLDESRHLERWVSPPHNSFLTISFHTGFVSVLLLFFPMIKILFKFILIIDCLIL